MGREGLRREHRPSPGARRAFLETLPLTSTDRVLDLCCGSGDFTRTIADLVSEGHVVGLDAQPSMIGEARIRAGANQSFVTGPVQHLATLVPDDAALDVVMSRSALHWVPEVDHPGLLAQCFRVLRPGGVLRLEMGGGDNVRAMRALLDSISGRLGGPTTPWTFLGAGYYLESSSRRPGSRSSTAGSAPSPSTARSTRR